MDNSLNYHFTSLVNELKVIFRQEVSAALQQTSFTSHIASDNSNSYLVTTTELANHFKISKSHVDKLRKKHKNFPTVKLDGAVRFNVKDVEDFFQNLKSE